MKISETKLETFSAKITIKLRNFQYYALSLVSYKKNTSILVSEKNQITNLQK